MMLTKDGNAIGMDAMTTTWNKAPRPVSNISFRNGHVWLQVDIGASMSKWVKSRAINFDFIAALPQPATMRRGGITLAA